MRRNKAIANRSLELFTARLPIGGKSQLKISVAMAVAISPLSKPSSLEMARTASRRRSIDASLPIFIRWQNAAMNSSRIAERKVPGSDRRRNTRALSTENAAPRESNKKVPQTPRRQPATNPVVNPPITSPSQRKLRPHIHDVNRQANDRVMKQETRNQEPQRNVPSRSCFQPMAAVNLTQWESFSPAYGRGDRKTT